MIYKCDLTWYLTWTNCMVFRVLVPE